VSEAVRLAVAAARRRAAARLGISEESGDRPRTDEQRLVIVGAPDYSRAMATAFDALFRDRGPIVSRQVLDGPLESNLDRLLAATAVVFDGRVFTNPGVRDLRSACAAIGIPCYFFADEHWLAAQDGDADDAGRLAGGVSPASVIRRMTGVIVTSDDLAQAVHGRRLNDSVLVMGPALDLDLITPEEPRAPSPGEPLRVLFPGHALQAASFRSALLPALERLAAVRPVVLVTTDDVSIESRAGTHLLVERASAAESFVELVLRWRRLGPHVLVCPSRTRRAAHVGGDEAVMLAHLIGAVPVAHDEEPSAGRDEADGVVRVPADTVEGWQTAIVQLAEAERWTTLRGRLAARCTSDFDPRHNEAVVSRILDRHAGGLSPAGQLERRVRLVIRRRSARARQFARRAARWLRAFFRTSRS
jgi:hypothetical protein